MSSGNGTSPPHFGTPLGRTEQTRSCVQDAHVSDPDRTRDLVQNAGIGDSVRTEHASPLRPPLGPKGAARVLTAKIFSDAVDSLWEQQFDWATNECLAERYCGNTESVIRRWKNGDKLVPLAALVVLPAPLAERIAREVLSSRAVTMQRTLGSLRDSVAQIDKPISPTDREAAARGLRDARDRIIARLDRLAAEGK